MTETLVVVSPPSKELRKASRKETASSAAPPAPRPLPPGGAELVGGLLALSPVQAERAPVAGQERGLAREMVRRARASGMALTGPGGLLKSVTKLVLETALEEEEMSEHLGYDKHALEGRIRGSSRNGKRSKTVLTDAAGAVEIDVPRDRDGMCALVIARLAAVSPVRYRHGRVEPVQSGPDQWGDQRALR